MGQKVNPHGLRVGVIKDWDSKWYAEADFADCLVEDYNIRKFLKKRLYSAGISKIEIERASDRVKVIIYTAKPGVVIGKGGAEIEKLKKEVQKLTDKKLFIDIKEIKRPDKDAQLVAESIAQQLENRTSFRRAMKSTMGRTMKTGVKGIKTAVGGRLGGADIARTEFYSEGTIPLQTLRADIDYGFAEACFDAKECAVKTFPLQNVHEHQILFMKEFEEQGGIAFIILHYTSLDEIYYLPFADLYRFWQRMEQGGRKSFTYEEIDKAFIIRHQKDVLVHYLDAIQRDLNRRAT